MKMAARRLFAPHMMWLVLMVIVLLAGGIRYRLLDVPLERDEGEYAYAGQLILQGIPPYKLVYNMKLPGIYAAYAVLLSIFGNTHTAVHTGLLVVNATTIVLIFLLGKRLMNVPGALVAAATFGLLSVSQSVQGIFANSEHFVILFSVGGLLVMLHALDERRVWLMFLAGVLLGIGFLMKQHGIAFPLFGLSYVVIHAFRERPIRWRFVSFQCLTLALGAVLPYVFVCLILALAGVFGKFWFWTVEYARTYISQVPVELAWLFFKSYAAPIVDSALLLWGLVGFGLIALIWNKRIRPQRCFVALFAMFSLLSICLGGYFRPHYFVLMLPASALLAGVAIEAVTDMLSHVNLRNDIGRAASILVAVVCLTVSVYQQRRFLFEMTAFQASRSTFALNPFPECLEVARFIKARTRKDDRVAVLGSEPQIYFYSNRRSASGYIYMYALTENHDFALQMQREMISEIEKANPKFIVFVGIPYSWSERHTYPRSVLKWLQHYKISNYRLVGLVELFGDKAVYDWAPNVKRPANSHFWVSVLQRND